MSRIFILLTSCCFTISSFAQQQSIKSDKIVATYSIVAWDSSTGDLGVAVQSKFLGVGAVVPYAKAGVGAVATQAYANTSFGPRGLDLIEGGLNAQQTIDRLVQNDTDANLRQIGIVDAHGNSYAYTGSGCMPYAGQIVGRGFTVQGNILASEDVVKAMANAFQYTTGDFPDRLINALDAAEKAGGDKRGRQSAVLLVVRENGGYGGYNDRYIDIRIDDDSLPLFQLRRIYNIWQETFLLDAQLRTINELNKRKKFLQADAEKKRLIGSLNNILHSKADDPEVLNNVAWILATTEIDRERALDLAKRAVKLVPGNSSYLDTMAECLYHLGDFDAAIAIESELVAKEPATENYWKQLKKFKEGKQKGIR